MNCRACGTQWFSAAAFTLVDEGCCPQCGSRFATEDDARPDVSTGAFVETPLGQVAQVLADAYEDISGAGALPSAPMWLRVIHPAL